MLNVYFAPIHIDNPEAAAAVGEQLAFLQEWGVHVKNTEVRDPAMLPYVDGMIAEFSYGDPQVETEVLRAHALGKPVLALVSQQSRAHIPESVLEAREATGNILLLPRAYQAPRLARLAMKVFIGGQLGYHGPEDVQAAQMEYLDREIARAEAELN